MPVEQEYLPYLIWLFNVLPQFAIAIGVLLILGTLFSYVGAAVRLGPSEAFYLVARIMLESIPDFLKTSPRRVLALARLAVQESIRRKVLVVFAVFIVLLLFGGWYLDTDNPDPARLYINFVLTSTNYLMLLLGFSLSAFSLPADFKNRTMYTITTKPVRTGEIVLGRFLGFAAVGTTLMVLMCAVSYVFVVRGLAHQHQLEGSLAALPPARAGEASPGWEGSSTFDKHHRHKITINSQGIGRTDEQMGHWHEVTKQGDEVAIGSPEGMLTARVPLVGSLRFRDRAGMDQPIGIYVGDEWLYRSYIEGQSAMRAIWTFDGVTPNRFPEGLPLEMTLRVYRTYKGDIEEGIGGSLRIVNPDPAARVKRSAEIPFTAQEFGMAYQKFIPRKLSADERLGGQEIDLFEDLVSDGRVLIELRCTDSQQYFGVAKHDLYLRAADRPFFLNFLKGYFDLWLQLMIAIAFGTLFSTFLSGAVAMLAAVASMVVGFVAEQLIFPLASGEIEGGGPIQASYRLITQRNQVADLELGNLEFFIRLIDHALVQFLRAIANLLPNYTWFDTVPYVAYGMNISGDATLQHATLAAAYCLVAMIVAYFFLKTREIAAD